MMRKTFITSSLVFMTLPALAQRIEIGIGGGYAQITGPTSYTNATSNLGYGFVASSPVTAIARYTSRDERISFFSSVAYMRLLGKGFLPPHLDDIASLLPWEIENKTTIWSASLGIQWPVFASGPTPLLSTELLISSLGEISTTRGTYQGDIEASVPGGIRYGVSVGAGFRIPLLLQTALDIDAKYVSHSLFGRPGGERSVNSVQILGSLVVTIWSDD